jgi:hypothetical protein
MRKGSTEDWRKVLKDATGKEISAKAMVNYFEPLTNYLKELKQRKKVYAGRKFLTWKKAAENCRLFYNSYLSMR